MQLSPVHPIFALTGLAALVGVAHLVGQIVPFYRRELRVEDATRLTPLDGLRGLLCFSVLFHHAAVAYFFFQTGQWRLPPSRMYTMLGQEAVALFFCITGYLFWSKAIAEHGQMNYWTFLRARVFRVAPLYWFSCLAAILLVITQVPWTGGNASALLGRMMLVGVMKWGKVGSFDFNAVNASVAWTLRHEWRFYLLLPIAAVLLRWRRPEWAVLAAIIAFCVGIGISTFFLIGILSAHAVRRPILPRVLRSRAASLMCIAALLAIAALPPPAPSAKAIEKAKAKQIAAAADDPSDPTAGPATTAYSYRGYWLTAIVFIPIACGNTLFGLLTLSGARLLGMISYSVYLLHGIVLYACRPLLRESAMDAGHPLAYWLRVGVVAALVLTISLCTYAWIELPFIRLERRLRRRAVKPTEQEVTAPLTP